MPSFLTITGLLPFLVLGAISGIAVLAMSSRGVRSWARTFHGMAMAGVAGAILGALVARLGPYGLIGSALMALVAGWGGVWVTFAMVSLWRTNLMAGRVVDPGWRLAWLSAFLATMVIVGMLMLASVALPAASRGWAGAVWPLLAGAWYRLLLVVVVVREQRTDTGWFARAQHWKLSVNEIKAAN